MGATFPEEADEAAPLGGAGGVVSVRIATWRDGDEPLMGVSLLQKGTEKRVSDEQGLERRGWDGAGGNGEWDCAGEAGSQTAALPEWIVDVILVQQDSWIQQAVPSGYT